MVDTVYEAGTSLADVRIQGGSVARTSDFSSTWVSESLQVNSGDFAYSRFFGPVSSGGIIFQKYALGGSGARTGTVFALCDGTDTDMIRLVGNGTTISLQYYNGSGYTTVGSGWTYLSTDDPVVITWDIPNGALAWRVAGVAIASASGLDLSAVNDIESIHFDKWNGGGLGDGTAYSEWIVTSGNPLTKRYYCKPPNAAGSNSGWTGAYTDIDETGINVADKITSASDNEVSTFKAAARTFAGYEVDAFVFNSYARKSSTGPDQIIPMMRVGGTNYEVGAAIDLSLGYKAYRAVVAVDPSTAGAWGLTNANDVNTEFGFKSASA